MPVDHFNDVHIRPLITKLSLKKDKNIHISGDFNINLLNVSSHAGSSEFFDIMSSNHLLPTISIPTKLNTSGNHSLIDNIYTNVFNPDIISGNITFNVSDGHLPSFVIIPKPNQNHLPKKHNFYKRSNKNFDPQDRDFPITKFLVSQELLNIDWNQTLETEKSDANIAFNNFYSTIEPIIDKYMPLEKVKNKEHKRRYKPWITPGIRRSMNRRDKLLHKVIKMKNSPNKLSLQAEYKLLRNQIVELTKLSKQNFYNTYFTSNNGNLRKIWQGIKRIINIKSQSFDTPSCILHKDGNIVTDPKEISDCFAEQFTLVADKILEQRRYNGDDEDYAKYLPPSNPNSIAILPVDGPEICAIIQQFNTNKGAGPNSIPPIFLKHMLNELAIPLSWIANISLSTGIHPDKLKLARIIPIYKKGSKLLTCNYRPISLLSNINKIFEKIVYSRVFSFLDGNNAFYEHQYGFRPKYSTNHALISITEKIREALDQGKIAIGVFIDLQKAFDTVNHSILLKKLHNYGIRGKMLDWFRSYLSNRQQFVSILGFDSKKMEIKHGVPQGSVLGPLLFLIYINDLHRSIKSSLTSHFADDTNLLTISETTRPTRKHPNRKPIHLLQSRVNRDLKGLNAWLTANKISLNAAKTELVIFRKPSVKCPSTNIKINGQKISPSSSIKYLGIYLDEFLNGSAHCDQLHTKLLRANGMIAKSRHYLHNNQQHLLTIYHSIFSSHMIYGCQVWGQTDSKYFKKIQTLQNNALRLITFAESFRDHVSHLYKDLNILKLRDFVTLQNLLLVHDYFNNNLPESFSGFFTLSREIHTHRTRGAMRGQLYVPNTESVRFGRKSIKLKSILSWNELARNFPGIDLLQYSRSKLKMTIVKGFTDNYT